MAERDGEDRSGQNEEEQDEDELKRKEEERVSVVGSFPIRISGWNGPPPPSQLAAVQLQEEVEAKLAAKLENRKANLNPAALRPTEASLKSLDGSVKKNTTFQRKLVSELYEPIGW